MDPAKSKNIAMLFFVAATFSLIVYACADKTVATTSTGPFSFTPSPSLPPDIDSNASDTALAAYAWQEFFALNWKSAFAIGGPKGEPDAGWSFAADTVPPPTVVWETYAHRSELSPYVYPMRPFDSACKYSYKHQPTQGAGNPSYGLLHNLDETSEIGSCNLVAFANDTNEYSNPFRVRYQAKVNQVEYDYIRSTYPSQDSLSNTVARTSQYMDSMYNGAAITTTGMLLKLPDGSVEVKTAWRPLRASDDTSKFFTRTVIDYSDEPNGQTFTYTNKTYALIGIHIIRKTKNHPSFVFATWEHVGVMQDSMRYILLTGNFPQSDSLGYMKPIRNPIQPVDSLATAYAHSLLPVKSVWRNYRLVGVQGKPTSDATKPNFFLANYVIESDSLLARFHGSGFSNPFDGKPNVLYNNRLYSVGGCQGCHGGGAQHTGSDFSFIVNSPNNAPDPVAGKPGSVADKFMRLKRR